MKKHPFILIEVLIAMAFLLLCISPFVLGPLLINKKMSDMLFELEFERRKEEIIYKVLKKPGKMKGIIDGGNKQKDISSTLTISIEGLGEKEYKCVLNPVSKKNKEFENSRETIFLITLQVLPQKKKEFKTFKRKIRIVKKNHGAK